MHRALLSLILLSAAIPASAQIGVYGTFSAANFRVPNTGWQYGSTFGLFDDHWKIPFFALGIDGRGAVIGGTEASVASGLVGPRIVFKPHVLPIMPYVEALGGVGRAEDGEGSAATSVTKFEYNFVGGVDYTVLPRIDWRVVEFSYGGLTAFNGSFNPRTLSTGIVFRIP
jgi:hypothetical protein